MDYYLWLSSYLITLIAVLWLHFRKGKILPLRSIFQLFLFVTVCNFLTQYALMAERNDNVIYPIRALPDLNYLYLAFHYFLITWLVLGYVLPSPFYRWSIWPMLFLYPTYLYFRTFFSAEIGTPYPLLYAIVLLQIWRESTNSNASPSPASKWLSILSPGLLIPLFSFLFLKSSPQLKQ